MADNTELNNVPAEVTPPTEPVVEQPAAPNFEELAAAEGWVPQDQWTGDPNEWRPAKEFVDRGKLFKKIDEQNRKLKRLEQGVEEFRKHHEQVRKIEYERALNHLKAQKKEALLEGDADAVIDIDEKIADTKAAQKQAAAQPQVQEDSQPDPAFTAWIQRNQWYGKDKAMKAVADAVAYEIAGEGVREPAKILAEVEKRVRQEFPHKFTNPNRERASAVEGSTNRGTSNRDTVQLSDDERRVMQKIVATGIMTKEQYLKEYKETKERK
jgi:hypothetical protein